MGTLGEFLTQFLGKDPTKRIESIVNQVRDKFGSTKLGK